MKTSADVVEQKHRYTTNGKTLSIPYLNATFTNLYITALLWKPHNSQTTVGVIYRSCLS